MAGAAQAENRVTADAFFRLVETGVIGPEDRVELLEGVIVAMSPQNPPHASATTRVQIALTDAIGKRAVIRVQLPLVLGGFSVPEPDVAVVPGAKSDYDREHPSSALLVVEVADTSVIQDRLTKAAMYAAGGIPEYWILNLVNDRLEIFRSPDRAARRYGDMRSAGRGERLELVAFAGAIVAVEDLLPAKDASRR